MKLRMASCNKLKNLVITSKCFLNPNMIKMLMTIKISSMIPHTNNI